MPPAVVEAVPGSVAVVRPAGAAPTKVKVSEPPVPVIVTLVLAPFAVSVSVPPVMLTTSMTSPDAKPVMV